MDAAGPPGTILVHPDDVEACVDTQTGVASTAVADSTDSTAPIWSAATAANEIATEQSDCWVSWHDLRLQPDAVTAAEQRRR